MCFSVCHFFDELLRFYKAEVPDLHSTMSMRMEVFVWTLWTMRLKASIGLFTHFHEPMLLGAGPNAGRFGHLALQMHQKKARKSYLWSPTRNKWRE